MVATVTASGIKLPMMFIFSKSLHALPAALDQELFISAQEGYMTKAIFRQYIEWLVRHLGSAQPHLLILDGHKSRNCPEVADYGMFHNACICANSRLNLRSCSKAEQSAHFPSAEQPNSHSSAARRRCLWPI